MNYLYETFFVDEEQNVLVLAKFQILLLIWITCKVLIAKVTEIILFLSFAFVSQYILFLQAFYLDINMLIG